MLLDEITNRIDFKMGSRNTPLTDDRLQFLATLSSVLLKTRRYRKYPDLIAFGFFIRKKNLLRWKKEFESYRDALGLGTVLHVTPNNVPMNFALSWVYGFVTGNSNIVKAPISKFDQCKFFVEAWDAARSAERLQWSDVFIDFDRRDSDLPKVLAQVDGLVGWGGNTAVNELRKASVRSHLKSWFFPDKVSIGLINASYFCNLSEDKKVDAVSRFIDDSMYLGQQACSSPCKIVWIGSDEVLALAKQRFWTIFQKIVGSDELGALDKIDRAMESVRLIGKSDVRPHNDWIDGYVRIEVSDNSLNDKDTIRGGGGLFWEFSIAELSEFASFCQHGLQTVTTLGVDKQELAKVVIYHGVPGCDRIVDFGQAMQFNLWWDGKNPFQMLTRHCVVQ
jgi:hypothetical protein